METATDLSAWTPRPRPDRVVLPGRYVRLEPLDPARHGADLLAAARAEPARLRYLFEDPADDRTAFATWLTRASASPDPLFWAVVDAATNRAAGRQSLLRIEPAHGVIEIGNILWGAGLAGTRAATEAWFLHAAYAFDALGYRRFEWKCHDRNEASKRAAHRFGFTAEGVFRQHMVHKGANRDTAWFAIIDADWPRLRARTLEWLDPSNFDADGRQRRRLQDCG